MSTRNRPREDTMTDATDREDLCRRCGRCCYAKVILDDEVYYTDIPCRHLDPGTHLCMIYEKRFEIEPDCLTVKEGIKRRVFPADCPYVADLAGYRAPHTDCDLEEMSRLYNEED